MAITLHAGAGREALVGAEVLLGVQLALSQALKGGMRCAVPVA